MVVCKFFLEGCCRYGQNCRFEHVYGSKYSYHANAPAQAAPQSSSGRLSDEQLMQQVQADVQSALKGGQWLLSSYAPFKEKPVFPGISDLSPEEARLFIYEAKAKNNVEQAVAYMNNLAKETRSKYEQLLTTSPNIIKAVRSLYKGESPPPPFTSTTPQSVFGSQSTNASSIFRSANQQASPFGQNNSNQISSPFGQSSSNQQATSPFGQNTSNQQATSPFAQNNSNQQISSPFAQNNSNSAFNQGFGQNTAQSIFSQANANSYNPGVTQNTAQTLFSQATQNVFGAQPASPAQNFFGSQDTAKNIFAQANKSPFGTSPPQTTQAAQPFKSPFDQPSPFAQSSQNTSNFFQSNQTPANVFGQATNVFQQPPSDDAGVYSKESDLSPEDLNMYKADSFKLGQIPEMPPPHSLCV